MNHVNKLARVLLLSGLVCQTSACEKQSEMPAQGTRLEAPVKAALRPMMARHADRAMALTRAVALDDLEGVVKLASEILEEPRPAQATGAPDTLNEGLPKAWFEFDQKLQIELNGLREAARARNEPEVVTSFARVLTTCRSCHQALRTKAP